MYIPKFNVAAAVIILSAIIWTGATVALLQNYYTIHSSGSIALPECKLVITATAGGTTNPNLGEHSYDQGSTVNVTAIPNSGYSFDHWELDGSYAGRQNPITVTMDTDHTLHAVFEAVPSGVRPREADKSEIRALVLHPSNFDNPDWELIAQTAADYDIDMLLVAALNPNWANYHSAYVPNGYYVLTDAINECHARGIEVHVVWNMGYGVLSSAYETIDNYGSARFWTCPTKQVSRTLAKNLVEELVTNFDVDGIMYDYCRYDVNYECYCPECKAAFEAYLGETILPSDWPPTAGGGGPFAPGGARYNEFMEWRCIPWDELIRDCTSWAKAIKPEISISAAVWAIYNPSVPAERKYWIGQDFTQWTKEGWLDWVNVMVYTTDLTIISNSVLCSNDYVTGGPEGKIPVVINLANCFPGVVPPAQFKTMIDTVRAGGADGWAIWRYGGPGDGMGSGAPDIRTYLDLIDLYPTFSISDINVSVGSDVTVTWTTDLPATSKVEYSTSPMFTATSKLDTTVGIHYWDVDNVPGTVVEYTTPVTNHSITLEGLSPGKYYFRVQSQDADGTTTSKVYTFEL